MFFFLAFAFFVFIAARQLVKFADLIVENTKLGGNFFGGVAIAAITSAPELITEIVQASSGFPGAGNADDLGSNAFSTFLLAIFGLILFRKTKFLNHIKGWTLKTIIFTFILSVYVLIIIFFKWDISIGNSTIIGLVPLSLFLFYIIYLFLQYRFGNEENDATQIKKDKNFSLKKTIINFCFWGFLLIGCSFFLNVFASSMKEGFNLKENSIGGIFLSISTSLPEIVAFALLLKRKQREAAIMTLVGSHIFNLGISFFGDLAYDQEATFKTEHVHNNWPIALINVTMLAFLLLHIFVFSKIKSKTFYLIMPSLMSISYLVGWSMILFV